MADMVEVSPSEGWPTIPEFFRGKSIFITGGSGFMGKVLIEKLLWSCPDLECIYILLRPRKGKDGHQRLIELEKLKVFERLRIRDPDIFLNKVKVINGDVKEIGLGISSEERQILINAVSIVFHAAASVRFDDSLKEAVLMNTRGAREVMSLCKEMKKLDVIIHVSTAFSNITHNPVYEKLYPPPADWKQVIEIAETIDDYKLKIITPKYLSAFVNTYIFTKNLSEHVVNDLRGDIPTVIFRPSIVTSSETEPFPGWLDNFNGPVGLLVASGKGILRTAHYNGERVRLDVFPVDHAINAMIVAAWKHGIMKNVPSNIPVYNCSSKLVYDITLQEITLMGLDIVREYPLNDILWIPGGGFTTFKIIHLYRLIVEQLLPALIVDLGLKLASKKPMLFKIQRKIYTAFHALKYFQENEFLFENEKLLDLRSTLLKSDVKSFSYDYEKIEPLVFFKTSLMGVRKYLLNEQDETMPRAREHFRRMYLIDKITRVIFLAIILWCLYKSALVRNVVNETVTYCIGTTVNQQRI